MKWKKEKNPLSWLVEWIKPDQQHAAVENKMWWVDQTCRLYFPQSLSFPATRFPASPLSIQTVKRSEVLNALRPSSPTSLTSSSCPGYWVCARRAAAGDLWWVMVTMLPGAAVWPACLWELGDEDGVRWGRREKLRARPEDEEPWRRGDGQWNKRFLCRAGHVCVRTSSPFR